MPKLYYKFGAMGSSKSASALMCRFNYIQKGASVLLMKPKLDTRDSQNEVVSRIGLSAPCISFAENESLQNIYKTEKEKGKIDVIIVDECQFCTKEQIDELRQIAEEIPVLCYGLKTNFKTELFGGSKRLLELADSIQEIKSVCQCGKKAIFNGRFVKGLLVTEGKEVEIGGNEKYKSLCWTCYNKEKQKAKIYADIISYLKKFKELESAGEWSSDTSADNIVMQKPHVIYDDVVKDFLADFKQFQVKDPEKILQLDGSLESLRKASTKDKDFDYCMALISFSLKLERTKPGIVKTLIEDGTMQKWLKQIKKCVDNA